MPGSSTNANGSKNTEPMNSQPDMFAGRRTAVTITCRCGHVESFEGDLLPAVEASQDSQRWFLNKRGFFVCEACAQAAT
jgi:hypothetical protein